MNKILKKLICIIVLMQVLVQPLQAVNYFFNAQRALGMLAQDISINRIYNRVCSLGSKAVAVIAGLGIASYIYSYTVHKKQIAKKKFITKVNELIESSDDSNILSIQKEMRELALICGVDQEVALIIKYYNQLVRNESKMNALSHERDLLIRECQQGNRVFFNNATIQAFNLKKMNLGCRIKEIKHQDNITMDMFVQTINNLEKKFGDKIVDSNKLLDRHDVKDAFLDDLLPLLVEPNYDTQDTSLITQLEDDNYFEYIHKQVTVDSEPKNDSKDKSLSNSILLAEENDLVNFDEELEDNYKYDQQLQEEIENKTIPAQ